jgi:hypothetical protein
MRVPLPTNQMQATYEDRNVGGSCARRLAHAGEEPYVAGKTL